MRRSLIVVPTYNELSNLGTLVQQLLDNTHPATDILVVDDNSPDGTGQLADELANKEHRVHVLHRPGKLGLGSAYRAAFSWGIDAGYHFLYQIDSDFSHNPRSVPQFQNLLESNVCDVVVGTRYAAGGQIEHWNALRRLISRFGCWYSQLCLRLPISDVTGGFNGWKADVLEAIQIGSIRSEGYCFQIELKSKAYKAGFRIRETPIIFSNRKRGKSKMSHAIVLEAAWRVPFMALAHKRSTGKKEG